VTRGGGKGRGKERSEKQTNNVGEGEERNNAKKKEDTSTKNKTGKGEEQKRMIRKHHLQKRKKCPSSHPAARKDWGSRQKMQGGGERRPLPRSVMARPGGKSVGGRAVKARKRGPPGKRKGHPGAIKGRLGTYPVEFAR